MLTPLRITHTNQNLWVAVLRARNALLNLPAFTGRFNKKCPGRLSKKDGVQFPRHSGTPAKEKSLRNSKWLRKPADQFPKAQCHPTSLTQFHRIHGLRWANQRLSQCRVSGMFSVDLFATVILQLIAKLHRCWKFPSDRTDHLTGDKAKTFGYPETCLETFPRKPVPTGARPPSSIG